METRNEESGIHSLEATKNIDLHNVEFKEVYSIKVR